MAFYQYHVFLILVFGGYNSVYGQINLEPIVGEFVETYDLNLNLLDTGAIGSSLVWDYSSVSIDSGNVNSKTTRLLTIVEQNNFPEANIAIENSNGETVIYHSNNDSLSIISHETHLGIVLSFTDYAKVYDYPVLADSTYQDSAIGFYYSGTTLIEIDYSTTWSITGQGSLITPNNVYQNVSKLSRYSTSRYISGSTQIAFVHTVEILWVVENENTPILRIAWNSNDGITKADLIKAEKILNLETDYPEVLKYYPNPVVDQLNFSKNLAVFFIVDMNGKKVVEGRGQSIDISELKTGIYILNYQTNGQWMTKKIVKQ